METVHLVRLLPSLISIVNANERMELEFLRQ